MFLFIIIKLEINKEYLLGCSNYLFTLFAGIQCCFYLCQ